MKTVGRARKADRTQTPSTTTWACRMVHRYLACRGNTTATTLPTQTQYTLSGATDASSSLNDLNKAYFWRPNKEVPKELTKCTEGEGVTSYCGTFFCVCVCAHVRARVPVSMRVYKPVQLT